jgi:hypothetical protein
MTTASSGSSGPRAEKSAATNRFAVAGAMLVAVGILSLLAFSPGSGVAHGAAPAGSTAAPAPRTHTRYAKLPMRFEPNRGQSDERVRFLARGNGYALFLTAKEAILALRSGQPRSGTAGPVPYAAADVPPRARAALVRMRFVGANGGARMVGRSKLPGHSSYLTGGTSRQWHTDIPAYARTRYRGIYPGVDLDFYGNQGRLEYDFTLAPGANPRAIRLHFAGATGLEIGAEGNLVLHTPAGDLEQLAPEVYQEIGGRRRRIPGRYVLVGDHEVGFEVGPYDPGRTLVIDPVMVFSTFLGGIGFDTAYGVAVDADGAVYLTGWNGSTDFPTTTGSYRSSPAGGYVVKLAPAGDSLVYAAVIPTIGKDIAVDSKGDAWVTSDSDGRAGAIYELDASGSALLYSQTLSGGGATGIAVDLADNVYVVGSPPTDFAPTFGAFQTTPGSGSPQAFVMKLDPSWNVVYASFLGTGGDSARDVAVDANGVAYVTGYTYSATFPTRNAFQARGAGSYDGFVSAVDPQGTALLYSTYLGGTQQDFAEGIAVDTAGSAYVTGRTLSWDFPLASPFQPQMNSGEDAFVTKLAPDGGSLIYSTFLGGGTVGSGNDEAYAIAVDAGGAAVVTGRTDAPNFPVVEALQPTWDGLRDAFVAKLNAAGSGLLYATYLGGSLVDEGWSIAVDGSGGTYVAGATHSYDFPTAGPLQPTNPNAPESDAFVAKISETAPAGPLADVSVSMVDSADPVHGGDPVGYTLTYTNHGPDVATGIASLIRLDPFATFVSLTASQGSCADPGDTSRITCDLGSLSSCASATVNVGVDAPAVDGGSMGSDVFVTADEFDPAVGNDSDREVTLIADQIFTLNVSVTGSGTVTSYNVVGIGCPPDCTQDYPGGQGVILKETAASGWTFDHWAGDCTGTGDCTVTMTADRTVSAVFVRLPEATDTVGITLAEYDARRGKLRVEATGTDPSATLQVFVTSTDALIGTLDHKGSGYRGRFDWPSNPQNVTVRSSSGGSDSAAVTLK